MVNSGHTVKTTREIIISGVKGYQRKVARCQEQGLPNTGVPARVPRAGDLRNSWPDPTGSEQIRKMKRMASMMQKKSLGIPGHQPSHMAAVGKMASMKNKLEQSCPQVQYCS